MRRSLLLPVAIATVALVGACTSSSAPAWTYAAPTAPPSTQPAASGASAAPGASAPGASAPASAVPGSQVPGSQPPASGGTAGGPVQISAQGVQFEQKDVASPAGAAFTIHFDNKDAGQPHNVDIKDASGASVFKGDIVTGPATADYQVPALTAGTYTFVCDVHSNMTGTLTAG